jgi:hypothetical protein
LRSVRFTPPETATENPSSIYSLKQPDLIEATCDLRPSQHEVLG